MNYIARLLITETLKLKRTIIPWVLFLPPIIYGFLMQQLFVQGGDGVLPPNVDPWESLQSKYWPGMLMLFVPLFVAMINSVSYFMDNKGSIWKMVYTMPIPKSLTFSLKSFYTLLLIFILFMLVALVVLPVALSVNLILGEEIFSYNLHFFFSEVVTTALKAFLGSLFIWSLHNWLSYRFENYIISVTIALLGSVTTVIAIQGSEYIIYFPYAYPYLSVVSESSTSEQVIYTSLIGSVILFIGSLIDMNYFNYNKS